MSQTSTGRAPDPTSYEIRTQGHLDARWTAWFDGLVLTRGTDGTTVIHVSAIDQAALYAVLLKLRDLGLPLLSVTHAPPRPRCSEDGTAARTDQR